MSRPPAFLISPSLDTHGTLGTQDNGLSGSKPTRADFQFEYSGIGEMNLLEGNRAWQGGHGRHGQLTETDPFPACTDVRVA